MVEFSSPFSSNLFLVSLFLNFLKLFIVVYSSSFLIHHMLVTVLRSVILNSITTLTFATLGHFSDYSL